MTTPALAPPLPTAPVVVDGHDPVGVAGTACLLLAIEACDARRFVCRPLAHAFDGFVAATVMIDLGEGPLPFPLDVVRLTATCLRADPPFAGSDALADGLDLAADQAEAAVALLLGSLN